MVIDFVVVLNTIAGTGFGKDEGASLLLAFRGLQGETAAQGQIHRTIAHELESLVADPFDAWSQGYKVCNTMTMSNCFPFDVYLHRNAYARNESLLSTLGCAPMNRDRPMYPS